MRLDKKKSSFSLIALLQYDSARVVLSILLVMIVTSIFSEYFLTGSNLSSVLRGQSIIGIMAIGQLLVILTSGIDISVGSVFGLSGALVSVLLMKNVPMVVCLLSGVVCGGIVGYFNGFLISRFKLAPFIVTLGTMGIVSRFKLYPHRYNINLN